MHKPQAGVQPHLCLLAPLVPLAPCRCLRTPRTCPQTLNQNPRRLFAAPAGNTSGMKAKNMNSVVLPRAHEMLPKHHFLHNTSCKSARNTRKPLRTMYRFHEHRQAHPILSLHMRVRCHAALRALAIISGHSGGGYTNDTAMHTRPYCNKDCLLAPQRQQTPTIHGGHAMLLPPERKQLHLCLLLHRPKMETTANMHGWSTMSECSSGIHCLFSTPFAALVSQSPPAPR